MLDGLLKNTILLIVRRKVIYLWWSYSIDLR